VVGLHNRGASDLNVTALQGSLNSVQNFAMYFQNFTEQVRGGPWQRESEERCSVARRGVARRGVARRGVARRGVARRGVARRGVARCLSVDDGCQRACVPGGVVFRSQGLRECGSWGSVSCCVPGARSARARTRRASR